MSSAEPYMVGSHISSRISSANFSSRAQSAAASPVPTKKSLPVLPSRPPSPFGLFMNPSNNASSAQATHVAHRKNSEDYRIKEFSAENHLKPTGSNFFAWKSIQEIILISNNWFSHTTGLTPRPNPSDGLEAFESWYRIDMLAKGQLVLNIHSSLYGKLCPNVATAVDLWRIVNDRFGKRSILAETAANARLRSKRIVEGESLRDHVFKLRQLQAECINCGIVLTSPEWHAIILQSLADHPEWKQLMLYGTVMRDPEDLISTLELQEAQGYGAIKKTESALQINTQGRGGRHERSTRTLCPNCKRGTHSLQNCWAPGGGAVHKRPPGYKVPAEFADKERANRTAQIDAQIIELQKERAQVANAIITPSISNVPETAQIASMEASVPERHFAYAVFDFKNAIDRNSWILDSGASSHMTRDKENFYAYTPVEHVYVQTARRGETIQAIGRGSMMARFEHNENIIKVPIHNVLHVLDLAHNLLSLSKLNEMGCRFTSFERECFLSKDRIQVAVGFVCENQWIMKMHVGSETVHIASPITDTAQPLHIWHQRLAHFGSERIREVQREHVASGLLILKEEDPKRCATCVSSKMAGTPSETRELRATRPGDIIHVDLEFIGHKSFSGADISLKFIDEYSNYVKVHALKSKDGQTILNLWMALCSEFRTQFGTTIKALHSDNGTEFVNLAMNTFNRNNGIHHHLTVPYRHEMNGRAERMNRTGADAVRSMLTFAGLPHAYWAKAYETFGYIHNRVGRSKDGNRSPFETLFKRVPSVKHVRTFGAIAYMHVPPEKRKKLDAKATRCILVRYRDDAAYRLMDPETREIHYSRDVIFDEFQSFHQLGTRDTPSDDKRTADPPGNFPDTRSADPPISVPDTSQPRRSGREVKLTKRRAARIEQADTFAYLDRQPGPDERVQLVYRPRIVAHISIPQNVHKVLQSKQAVKWHKAMVYEDSKLTEMGCWNVIECPSHGHIIKGMWVFNLKEEADGSLEYRARWVARGNSQIPGLEFGETFAASGDFIAAKIVASLSSHQSAFLATIDITSVYLHSPLSEDNLVIEYPTGFNVSGFSNPCCQLKRTLYGLREGARAWSDFFGLKLAELGFRQCITAPSVYVRSDAEGETIIATHVDDCTASCKSLSNNRSAEATRFKKDIKTHFVFKEKDARHRANLLGMTVLYNEHAGYVKLSIALKIDRALEKYNLKDALPYRTPMAKDALSMFERDDSEAFDNPPWPYSQLIGELLWIGTILRIDIAFAVNVLARYMQKPKLIHWEACKRVLRYLKGTRKLGIVYRSWGDEIPVGYSDSDWAGDFSDCKSTAGYVFMLNGSPVAWRSRKQTVVAKSTAEAEYLAVSSCAREAIWFRHFFHEIGRSFDRQPITLYVDNLAAIQMTQNPVYLSKMKHINIPAHHIRDEVAKSRIRLSHIPGTANPADILTKPLDAMAHETCVKLLGMP